MTDYHFIKNNKTDKIWWDDSRKNFGKPLFTFDKKKVFNVWRDYPNNLTKEQKEIFDKENPEWVKFLTDGYDDEAIFID